MLTPMGSKPGGEAIQGNVRRPTFFWIASSLALPRNDGLPHCAVSPPSTTISAPVVNDNSSLAR